MRMRHIKSDRVYDVLGTAIEEATLKPVVVYADEQGLMWTRPAAEFYDGRFAFVLERKGEKSNVRGK